MTSGLVSVAPSVAQSPGLVPCARCELDEGFRDFECLTGLGFLVIDPIYNVNERITKDKKDRVGQKTEIIHLPGIRKWSFYKTLKFLTK